MLTNEQIDKLVVWFRKNRDDFHRGNLTSYGKENIVAMIGEHFMYMNVTVFQDFIETLESAKEYAKPERYYLLDSGGDVIQEQYWSLSANDWAKHRFEADSISEAREFAELKLDFIGRAHMVYIDIYSLNTGKLIERVEREDEDN